MNARGESAVHALFGADLAQIRTAGYVDPSRECTLTAEEIRAAHSARVASLAGAGLVPGDVVGIWSEPASSFLVNFLAGLSSRLVVVPLDAHQAPQELTRRLGHVGARALLADPPAEAAVSCATAAGIPVLSGDGPATAPPVPPATYPADAAMVLFTSGSTGASKAAVITHRGLVQNALATAAWQECDERHTVAGTISLFHCFAILHTILGPLLSGAGVVAMAPFSVTRTLALAQEHRLSILPGTPTMFEMLLAHPEIADVDWSGLRCGVSGGALLRPDTQARFLDATGAPILNGYGITEATSFVAAPQVDDRHQQPFSIGYPVRGVECRVAGDGDEGELEVGGPSVMAGYLGDPEATRAVITPDGWLRTGDQVRIAADGEIFYVGRIKNVINRGGEKIHPEAIETALAGPAWAKHLVAVGVPDEVLGERIAVAVEASAEDFDEAELRTLAEQRLARHERPEWLIRLDEMPRTATGKLSLEEVARLVAAQVRSTSTP